MASFHDNESEARLDHAFERTLLESARADETPADAQAAWVRFSLALGGMTAASVGGNAAHPASVGGGGKGAAGVAAKWLLIGALGGSAVTAVLLRAPAMAVSTPASVAAPAAATAATAPATAAAPATARALPSVVTAAPRLEGRLSPASPPETGAVVAATARHDDHAVRARTPSPASPASPSQPSPAPPASPSERASTLAAEVSLLDAARTASRAGAFDDALRLAAEYRRDFPAGELTADADVIAMDALAGKGDGAELRARAARFLSRYPRDPHAAHVRTLLSE